MTTFRLMEPDGVRCQPLVERTDVDALVNTVNTVGIMGKGVALAFFEHFGGQNSRYVKDYINACRRKSNRLDVRKLQIFETESKKTISIGSERDFVQPTDATQLAFDEQPRSPGLASSQPTWIINFPTKRNWRDASNLEDVRVGLERLREAIGLLNIKSIAMPALGCGNGGLNWTDVEPMIEHELNHIVDLEIFLYPPGVY